MLHAFYVQDISVTRIYLVLEEALVSSLKEDLASRRLPKQTSSLYKIHTQLAR